MKEYFMIQYVLADSGCGYFLVDAKSSIGALEKAPGLIHAATGQRPTQIKWVGMAGAGGGGGGPRTPVPDGTTGGCGNV